MNSKKLISAVIIVLVFAAVVLGFWYWRGTQDKGSVETAKTVSDAVPEIQTNAGEKVPEINPLDRANPFKYTNPLR